MTLAARNDERERERNRESGRWAVLFLASPSHKPSGARCRRSKNPGSHTHTHTAPAVLKRHRGAVHHGSNFGSGGGNAASCGR